jgi:putative transposase
MTSPPSIYHAAHRPSHKVDVDGTYMVTCGTLHKEHLFLGRDRLALLHNALLLTASKHGWRFDAWAVFSNHYHFYRSKSKESFSAT